MAILEKEVFVKLHNRTISYYELKGYAMPRKENKKGGLSVIKGAQIKVKIEDLSNGSNVKVTKVCDECEKIIENQSYGNILKLRELGDGKDRCFQCARVKSGGTQRKVACFEESFEYNAIINNKEYLLSEFSEKNNEKLSKITYKSNFEYLWICPDCNSEYKMSAYLRTIDSNCPYCSGRRVNDTNSIYMTKPEIINLFVNEEDAHKFTHGSEKKAWFSCPDCGHNQEKVVNQVVKYGVRCSNCSDGISYPEKIMISILNQLNISYETQKTFSFFRRRKYDFYIPEINAIIEMHGGQHYNEGFTGMGSKTLKDQIKNDILKKEIALQNGITHYYIVDCRISCLDYIKHNIYKSELPLKLDLTKVSWLECVEFASKSLAKEVCTLWQSGTKDIIGISKKVKLGRTTIIKYLKQGATIGWCDYNPYLQRIKDNGKKNVISVVQLTVDNNFIRYWDSLTQIEKELGILHGNVSAVCTGKQKTAGGFKWVYKEDYEKSKLVEI